eukprot:3641835-Pleurochrysis_carterae.AAC.1
MSLECCQRGGFRTCSHRISAAGYKALVPCVVAYAAIGMLNPHFSSVAKYRLAFEMDQED